MAWTYEQKFNSLTDGDLGGQDSWSAIDGSPVLNVQTSSTYEGAKALSCVFSSTNLESDYRRDITGISDGNFYVAYKVSTILSGGSSFVALKDTGGSFVMYIKLPGGATGGALLIGTNAADVTVDGGAFSNDTWYVFNVEFDDTAQNNKYRCRSFRGGSWGSWTAWSDTVAAYTSITTIRILSSSGDGGGAHTLYWDTITPTDPTGSGSTTVFLIPSLLLMGVG